MEEIKAQDCRMGGKIEFIFITSFVRNLGFHFMMQKLKI